MVENKPDRCDHKTNEAIFFLLHFSLSLVSLGFRDPHLAVRTLGRCEGGVYSFH